VNAPMLTLHKPDRGEQLFGFISCTLEREVPATVMDAAKRGGGVPGVGGSLQRRGWHPTSVFGRAGAAAVASVLLRLNDTQIRPLGSRPPLLAV
jgi:hypothetical protein